MSQLIIIQGVSAQSIIFSKEEVDGLKSSVKESNPSLSVFIKNLEKVADYWNTKKPVSITDYKSPLTEAGANDYFSEGPYWWPDPDDPNAPYIKNDGERNPDRFVKHKEALMKMYAAVTSLSYAAYIFDNESYAVKAVEFINTWFVYSSTRMNPHLRYAQIIRNKPVIRGVGIIETHRFINLVDAMTLLKYTGYWNNESYNATIQWFEEYLGWLLNSEHGIDEKERGNNHSSWWGAQVAAISLFVNYKTGLPELVEYAKHSLIDKQIDQNSRQPLEEVRTLSLNYSVFNITALTVLASLTGSSDSNLFNYVNENNSSIISAIDYLLPFIKNPDQWELQQVRPFKEDAIVFLGLAGLKLANKNYLTLYTELLSDEKSDRQLLLQDPFENILSMIVINKMNMS